MKIEKISKMALSICVGVILVCFALFFGVGYDNPTGDYNEPVMTDVLMWLMYIMVVVTAILTLWSIIRISQSNKGIDSSLSTGVPSGKITLFTIVLLFGSLIVGVIFGWGETDFTAVDGTVTSAGWVTVVDAFCVSIGILMLVAIATVGVSMSGFLTKSASK